MDNRKIRAGLILGIMILLLCFCVSASAAVKIKSFPKSNELYLQWKPFGGDWTYPEIRDEANEIVIEGASSMGFASRAMQTYIYRQYPNSEQWDVQGRSKKGNGKDQIILLKPTAEQIANLPDDAEPRSDYPIDSNTDFDLEINQVKSPLKSIRIVYNPRWKIEEGGLTFLLWYKSKDRCEVYPGGFNLHYYCKYSYDKDEPFHGFSSAEYDAEGRLTKAVYFQKKTEARYIYEMVCEQPLYYSLTEVRYGSWVYRDGIWKNTETGEETENDPEGINLKKLPFKIIGDPGTPPEAADIIVSAYRNSEEVISRQSVPGLTELPHEKAVYSSWPGSLPLTDYPKMTTEDLGNGKSRITIRGLENWGIRPQSLCLYSQNSEGDYKPAGEPDENGFMTIDFPTGSNPYMLNWISSSEYNEISCDTERNSLNVNLYRGDTTYSGTFTEQADDFLNVIRQFPDGEIHAHYDMQEGILSSYTVYRTWEEKSLSYSYMAKTDKMGNRSLNLHYATLRAIDEDGDVLYEEEYSINSGKWEQIDGDKYVDCAPPPFADQCESLPIIQLVP